MSSINENDKNIKKITRLELLKEVQDMVNHNLLCYSKDYFMNNAKEGYETEIYKLLDKKHDLSNINIEYINLYSR